MASALREKVGKGGVGVLFLSGPINVDCSDSIGDKEADQGSKDNCVWCLVVVQDDACQQTGREKVHENCLGRLRQ